jgi:hypothetical protein
VKLFLFGCRQGHGESCSVLGQGYQSGRAGKRDLELALGYLERACKCGVKEACGSISSKKADALQAKIDAEELAQPYPCSNSLTACIAKCDQGQPASCTRLAYLYDNTMEGGTPSPNDLLAAVVAAEQACDGGDSNGCSYLAVSYRDGRGVPRSAERAAALFARVCGLGGGDCEWGGDCSGDDLQGCTTLCNQGHAASCWKLGHLYDKGKLVPRDSARAHGLFERACAGGAPVGCFDSGQDYEGGIGIPKATEKAAALYLKACEAGAGGYFACSSAARLARDPSARRALEKRACGLGSPAECQSLSRAP